MNDLLKLNENDFNPNPQMDENNRITYKVFMSEV